ncbi:MAG TPA: hypothetical protein VLC46_20395 [Thermoanaerobaculia bacterium]|jgi:hypothetical protein|nr:hypothetical protein [Thermoanaerobaculia bacterium]
MKRSLVIVLFAAIAAFVIPSAHAQCLPDEWCIVGCNTLGVYSISAFESTADASAFISTLSSLQQESARVTSFRVPGPHVVVAYRILVTGAPSVSVPVGDACHEHTVSLQTFSAIETAETELNQLPIDQRAGATIVAVPNMPNDPTTNVLLLVMRPPSGGVQDSSRKGR